MICKIEFGKRLAVYRAKEGKEQKEFGELYDASQQTVSAWEKGICLPPADVLQDLCDKLGLRFDDVEAGRRTRRLSQQAKAGGNITQNMAGGDIINSNDLTQEEREIVDLLRKYGNRAVYKKIRDMLLKIRKAVE